MFQNITQISNYRAERRAAGIYSIYEKQGNAYVHVAVVRISGKLTSAKIEIALND